MEVERTGSEVFLLLYAFSTGKNITSLTGKIFTSSTGKICSSTGKMLPFIPLVSELSSASLEGFLLILSLAEFLLISSLVEFLSAREGMRSELTKSSTSTGKIFTVETSGPGNISSVGSLMVSSWLEFSSADNLTVGITRLVGITSARGLVLRVSGAALEFCSTAANWWADWEVFEEKMESMLKVVLESIPEFVSSPVGAGVSVLKVLSTGTGTEVIVSSRIETGPEYLTDNLRPGDMSAIRSLIARLSRAVLELCLSAGSGPEVFLVTLKSC